MIDSPMGVYGVIDKFWQRPVVEVGPFGPDKGKAGKFLLLPQDFSGSVPEGCLAAKSKMNQATFIGRAFVKDGDIQSAVNALTGIKAYPLSKADNPLETRIVHAGDRPMDSIAPETLRLLQAFGRGVRPLNGPELTSIWIISTGQSQLKSSHANSPACYRLDNTVIRLGRWRPIASTPSALRIN